MARTMRSAYGATILGYAPDGTDAKGNVRFLVRYLDEGVERDARTRGFVTEDLHGVATGTRVNLIRDGRGSIVAIEKSPADQPEQGAPCGCCGTITVPPTPGTQEEGFYCEGCGTAWTTPTGPEAAHSCLIHRQEA